MNDLNKLTANPGYAVAQLLRARTTQQHDDPAVRARADERVADWVRILDGMQTGKLKIGSRAPVHDVPAWVTLKVGWGGYATDNLLAGGHLQPHEVELRRKVCIAGGNDRAVLNRYYLTDAGLTELCEMLATGTYRVNLPEEGALLVVAWLLQNGQVDRARSVLDTIAPFMDKLRFYPQPNPQPLKVTEKVHLQDAGTVAKDLRKVKTKVEIEKHREAVFVWSPLQDKMVALFLETYQDEWPCQQYPEGWMERARDVLKQYDRVKIQHKLCKKRRRHGGSFDILLTALHRCVQKPNLLTGLDVTLVRKVIAGIAKKRGLPESERLMTLRSNQATQMAKPTTAELARVLAERVSALPTDEGFNVFELDYPVTVEEAQRFNLPAGESFPDALKEKLRRGHEAPAAELVKLGAIGSAEVLAKLIPQISCYVTAGSIADGQLRLLYAALYRAFSKRRSLMLFNYESQVRMEELPWVQALDAQRGDGTAARYEALRALREVVWLAFSSFPETILPNPFLKEVRALVKTAGLDIPVVEEVAADIFMGDFTRKFVKAAQVAGTMLAGSLYARYYDLPYDRVAAMAAESPARATGEQQVAETSLDVGEDDDSDPGSALYFSGPDTTAFAALCYELAGEKEGGGWRTAPRGKVVEQEQLLTTHNLATLITGLQLTDQLRVRFPEMARRCFVRSCQLLQIEADEFQLKLQNTKNAAYAWRQMVFFLSLVKEDTVQQFFAWAFEHLHKQKPEFQDKFRPVLAALELVSKGICLTITGAPGESPARFLGWCSTRHYLLSQ
jgi:hypothetical protein